MAADREAVLRGRWTPENRLTRAAFRKLIDAHLFAAMDVDGEGRSVMLCSCGKRLMCEHSFHPEMEYRNHLANEMATFALAALRQQKTTGGKS